MSLDRLIESNVELQYPTSKPTYDLNFIRRTLKGIDPAYSFTRNSAATYIGPDGLIKTAAVNQPRFDFDVLSGECRGLLIEMARTNEISQSMPTTSGGGITNTFVSNLPGIFSTGRRLTSGGGNDRRITLGSNTSGIVFTYSFFARAGSQGSYVFLRNGTGPAASWSLITNTVTGDSFGTAKIENYGNGWWRCYATITGSGASGFLLGVGNSGLNSVNGDNIIIAGVQLERGTFPTSYIPTTTTTVTRQPDQLVLNKPLNSQGTLYVESRPTTGVPLVADNGSSSLLVSQETNQYSKSVLYYNNNRILTMSSDGGVPLDFSSSSSPSSLNRVSLGFDRLNNTAYINGHLKKFSYYSSPLSEDNLRALTGNKRSIIRLYDFGGPIVTSGLVLNLDAGNPASYPGSGTTWTDLSGNGNTGTLVNGVGYNSSNLGSLSFDGVDDYVSFVSNPSLTNQITVEVWVQLSSTSPNGTGWILGRENSYRMLYSSGSFSWVCATTNNAWYTTGTTTSAGSVTPHTQTYQVVGTYTGTNLQLYVNGELKNTGANISGNILATDTYYLIRSGAGNVDYGKGNFYSHKLYNRALTAAEIQQNFNATRNRFGI
jgi:hypothetical protein